MIETFKEITAVENTELALPYLQSSNWDLELAIMNYFKDTDGFWGFASPESDETSIQRENPSPSIEKDVPNIKPFSEIGN